MNFYLRWRHSKGFGVHSPYAYRFVTDVLCPGPCGYYSYWEVDRQLKGGEVFDHRLVRFAKFLIRVMVFLEAKRIIATGEPSPKGLWGLRATEIAAKSLGLDFIRIKPYIHYDFQEGDFLVAGGEVSDLTVISEALEDKVPVMSLNPDEKTRQLMETPIERGVLFNDPHILLLIPRHSMAYLSYSISLFRLRPF